MSRLEQLWEEHRGIELKIRELQNRSEQIKAEVQQLEFEAWLEAHEMSMLRVGEVLDSKIIRAYLVKDRVLLWGLKQIERFCSGQISIERINKQSSDDKTTFDPIVTISSSNSGLLDMSYRIAYDARLERSE